MGSDERTFAGELARVRVPERRDVEDSASIELAFVRFPCTGEAVAPPIVFLAGGPGGSGLQGCIGPATGRRSRLIDLAGVIGLEQRGTGLSRPNLSDGPRCSLAIHMRSEKATPKASQTNLTRYLDSPDYNPVIFGSR